MDGLSHEAAIELAERRFVEGQLPEAEGQALRAHLRECKDCRRAYDALGEAERALNPEGADSAAAQRLWPTVHAAAQAQEAKRRGRRRWPLIVVPIMAAAAAVAAVVFSTPATLPTPYGLEMTPSRSDLRGPTAPSKKLPILQADADLTLVLRPDRAHGRSVEARAYRLRGTNFSRIEGQWQTSEEGSLRLSEPGARALPEVGAWQVVVVVGASGAMPDDETVQAKVAQLAADSGAEFGTEGWRLWLRGMVRE